MSKISKIAVIGAGISGLTAAYELQQAGYEVTVFEKEKQVGGRMATRVRGEFPFDIGANHLANLYTEMRKYCKEFGIAWQKMEFENYVIVQKRKFIPLVDMIKGFGAFRLWMQISKKNRKVENFFDLNQAAPFDIDNAYDKLRRKVGGKIADMVLDSFVSSYQFHRAKEISYGAFIAILESFFYQKPDWELYHLKGEMSALPEAFARRLNKVHLGVGIESFEQVEGKMVLKYHSTSGLKIENFDAVVLATTSGAGLKIYKHPTEPQKQMLTTAKFAATISVAFKIPADLLGDTNIIWVPYAENPYISSYTNEAMKGPDLIKNGKTLISVWLHEEFAKTLLHESDETIFEAVKKHLFDVCPPLESLDQLENYDLQRIPEAMPKFDHKHITRVKNYFDLTGEQGGQGAKGVYLVGDYLNSVWTEGSIQGAQRLVEQMKTQLA